MWIFEYADCSCLIGNEENVYNACYSQCIYRAMSISWWNLIYMWIYTIVLNKIQESYGWELWTYIYWMFYIFIFDCEWYRLKKLSFMGFNISIDK